MRVLIADPDRVFREGLYSLLAKAPEYTVVGQAGTAQEAFSTAVTLKPDLVLMDLAFEDASGWELLDGLIAKLPETNVVILTSQNTDEGLFEAIRRGARGYILKGLPWEKFVLTLRALQQGEVAISRTMATRLVDAFRLLAAASDGRELHALSMLTAREMDVLGHLGAGASNQEIARRLVISEHTVKVHVRHILAKLKLKNRAQAAGLARRYGFAKLWNEPALNNLRR
jgi:DNA-binding NarL/FixJ family response regulator